MDLARGFRGAGHSVRVLLPGEGAAEKTLKQDGFQVDDLPLAEMTPGRKTLAEKLAYPFRARRAGEIVVSALGKEGADLIYANAPRCFYPAVLAAKKTGVPAVCGLHLIFTGGEEYKLIRWCFKQDEVKRAIFCSEAVAAPFADACDGKGKTIPYWVSPAFLETPQDRPKAKAAYGLSGGEVAVGVLGRISQTKGQRFFLESLMPLLPAHPWLRLFVAGSTDFEDPQEMKAVMEMAKTAADPSRVSVTGSMVDSLAFLDAMDILVVPSLWEEPFGLVAVEGMARGLPVVVTRSGGLKEIVEPGVTGLIADKDYDSLRRAVQYLVEDAGSAAQMGEAGRKRVLEKFNPARQIAQIVGASLG